MKIAYMVAAAIAILAVAVAVGVTARVRRRVARPPDPTSNVPTDPDFARLLNQGGPPAVPTPRVPQPSGSRGQPESDIALLINRLSERNAEWPEILAALNPRNDATIAELLTDLRGPHMFVPHVALNALQEACERLRISHPRAGVAAVTVLREALRRSDFATRSH